MKRISGNCPNCGKENSLEFSVRKESVQVRDLIVEVSRVYRHCKLCDVEHENTRDHDWRLEAFSKYRAKMNMKTPEQIKEWRENNKLTQVELAALLGWGEATVGRYEKGSLPSVAQSEMLESIMKPSGLLDAIKKRPDALPKEKRDAITAELHPIVLKETYRDLLTRLYANYSNTATGYTRFACEKAAALISVLADSGVHKTKLNKLMFYSDFLHYSRHKRSITGIPYARIGYGPVPEEYDTLFASMKALEIIDVEEEDYYGYSAERIRALDISIRRVLDGTELDTATFVLSKFSGWSAKDLVEYSHKERAWSEVGHKQKIPYEFANDISIKSLE